MYIIQRIESNLVLTFREAPSLHELEHAVAELMNREEYPLLNDIWVFGAHAPAIDMTGFDYIEEFVRALYPLTPARTKTAIVVDPGPGRAVMDLWKEHARALPYQTETFHSLEAAAEWAGVIEY